MPEFTVTHHIDAPVEKVWEVLNDFGSISEWSPGVKRSALTSDGPVGEGSTRHCDFAPMGGVDERIEAYTTGERMKINLFATQKLPISGAIADFNIASGDGGTNLTLHYNYTLNLMGRIAKRTTAKQMRSGMEGVAADLQRESERLAQT